MAIIETYNARLATQNNLSVITAEPRSEVRHALLNRGVGLVVKLLDKVIDIGPRVGHIPRLDWQEFFVGFFAQRIFQCPDVIHEVYRAIVANVVDPPRCGTGARIGVIT